MRNSEPHGVTPHGARFPLRGERMIRVLLVDDHAVVRTGFRLLLQAQAEITVVGEAESGETACQRYLELVPDVVVMDIAMPGMGGLEALRRIRAHHPQARVLALSAHDDPLHARRALREGALGFLSKRSAPEALLEAVTRGGRRAALHRSARLRRSWRSRRSRGPASRRSSGCRSGNSRCSCAWRAAPRVQRIAEDLKLSASTVGTHLYNIKQKLGVSNQSELTLIAIRHGLIEA